MANHETMTMTPEEKLFAAMHLRRIYAKQLAKAANVQESVFSHMKRFTEDPQTVNPRKMSPYYAERFAPHLGVTPEWFFDGRDCKVAADLFGAGDEPGPVVTPIGARPAMAMQPAGEIRSSLDSDVYALFEAAMLFVGEDEVRAALRSLQKPRSSVQPGRRDHGFTFHTSNPASMPTADLDVDRDRPESDTPNAGGRRSGR